MLLRRDARSGREDALPATALGNLLAAAVTLPFALQALPAVLTPRGAGVLLYLGVVQLGFAYWLFIKGVRRVPAAEASLICMLEPVLNPVWVLLGFGERPGRVGRGRRRHRHLRRGGPDAFAAASARVDHQRVERARGVVVPPVQRPAAASPPAREPWMLRGRRGRRPSPPRSNR